MGCSPPGSSVHGISQARILEWVAIPFSRGTSQPRAQTPVSCLISCIAGGFFTTGTTREELLKIIWIYSEESLQNAEILSAIPYEMATHSSILAWRQRSLAGYSLWVHRVGHDWATITLSFIPCEEWMKELKMGAEWPLLDIPRWIWCVTSPWSKGDEFGAGNRTPNSNRFP